MGIPLAALAIRPPEQPPDQLGQAAKAIQLKQLMAAAPLQQQALQQQVQAGAQENQVRGQQISDQQAQTAAMKAWDGKDLNELPGLLLKHGGSAQAVFGLKQNIVDQKTKLAKLDEDSFTLQQKKNDTLLGQLQAVTTGDDAGLPSRLTQAAQNAVQQGLLDQPHAQQIAQMAQKIQDPAKLKDALKVFEKTLMGQKEQFTQAQKERETAASESKAASEAERLELEKQGIIGPASGVDRQELADFMRKNPRKGPVEFAKFKASLAPQAQINVQGNLGGNQGDALATAVANGSMKIGDVLTARTPLPIRQQFLNKVMSINPQFNSANYEIEKGVMKDFTSGKSAQNLNAFNTAIEHAKQLQTATDALGNSDTVALNKIGNTLGYEFGSDKTTNFNVIKNALAGEVSKVFKGGQATDAEIKAVEAPFDAANSPAQLKGAINNAIKLMNSKRDALKQQYEQGRKAQPNFKDESSSSGTIYARDPSGKLHSAPAGTSLPSGWKQEQAP